MAMAEIDRRDRSQFRPRSWIKLGVDNAAK